MVDIINNHESLKNRLSPEWLNQVPYSERLQEYFMYHYDKYPAFFIGSLIEAYRLAFSSRVFEERRPLAIYIHHNSSKWNKEFCSNILCSEYLIDYLRENYIVWLCDITDERNRNILKKIWQELFHDDVSAEFSMEKCPLLIGIVRQSIEENDTLLTSRYTYEILLRDDDLISIPDTFMLETLFDNLLKFQDEFYENEAALLFDFATKSGLCLELLLEIAEYLSLNDAITAFSTKILDLLKKHNLKLPIIKPSDIFMKKTIQKIDSEQLVAIYLKAKNFRSKLDLTSRHTLKNIKILTFFDIQQYSQISDFKTYFFNLSYLSLYYTKEADFHHLCKIFNQLNNPIKQFEVHCNHVPCSHRRLEHIFQKVIYLNYTIEYLLLDIKYISVSLINTCSQFYNICLLKTIIDFIKIMVNIQYVHIIIHKSNLERLLDVKEWKSLVPACVKLKKVTLQGPKHISQNVQLAQKVLEIKNQMNSTGRTIEFETELK